MPDRPRLAESVLVILTVGSRAAGCVSLRALSYSFHDLEEISNMIAAAMQGMLLQGTRHKTRGTSYILKASASIIAKTSEATVPVERQSDHLGCANFGRRLSFPAGSRNKSCRRINFQLTEFSIRLWGHQMLRCLQVGVGIREVRLEDIKRDPGRSDV
ncbi:hypothetical protein BDY19DRAFT_907035 [Irpex rosettiformis]|uniref:Uncharacterized protein n=1 Tax=Irpex rosettiformis TaxID=378272 RepID=A0ACB8U233_9APHY|nr:hypothetical protein BDY19DRAFT_907035 [Irpex rosettiformis]